jgi:hypothetical protein
MARFRRSHLCVLTGLFTLFGFTGDIVADAIADARGNHCVSESSHSDSRHEKAPCSHCSCAVHNGSAVASTNAVDVTRTSLISLFFLNSDPFAPPRLPVAIDHPPQLA